jgi:uncharacterized protein (DUF1810 family)
MTPADPHDLARFVAAQDAVIDTVLAELTAGRKRTHWMWFVFPLLGARLVRCSEALRPHAAHGAEAVLGSVDAVKLRSCLTLFDAIAAEEPVFDELLVDFYGGERDPATLRLLDGA